MLFLGVIESGFDWGVVAAFLSAVAAFLSWKTSKEALQISRATISVSLMDRRVRAFKEMERLYVFLLDKLHKSPHFCCSEEDWQSFQISAEENRLIVGIKFRFELLAPSLGIELGGRCVNFFERVFVTLDRQKCSLVDGEVTFINPYDAYKEREMFCKESELYLKQIKESLYFEQKNKCNLFDSIKNLVMRK